MITVSLVRYCAYSGLLGFASVKDDSARSSNPGLEEIGRSAILKQNGGYQEQNSREGKILIAIVCSTYETQARRQKINSECTLIR